MQLIDRYVNRTDFKDYDDFYNNYRLNVPERFNFAYDIVDEYARTEPNKMAMVWCNPEGEEHAFTFADMKRMSDKTANFLLSIGIKKGDNVMTLLKRRYEFWFIILALHKIGAVIIPATHQLTKKDLVYRFNASSAKAVVSVNEDYIVGEVEKAVPESPTLRHKILVNGEREGWLDFASNVEKASDNLAIPEAELPCNEDMMLIYFTSGTSGFPKMAAHNYLYPFGHIITAKFWQQVEENCLHLTVADTGWAKCAWGKIYGQWMCGACQFVYDFDKFDPKDMCEIIQKYKLTSFCAPPTIYRFLIKEDLSKYDFSSLRHAAVAGEPLNPEVFEQFKRVTGLTIYEGFGQTEESVMLATFPYFEPRPGSMGRPSPGFDVDLVGDDLQPVDIGEEGQIVVRTDKHKPEGLFMGYYRDEEKTKAAWHDGMYFTGDMAWRDEDGFFWFVGRADDVIKSSGYRIGPFEVESALMEHPAVLECAITGAPHPVRGQVVKATVVLARGYAPSDELKRELQEHVKHATAPYKYPRIVEFVEELPKTISGKIRRVQLRHESQHGKPMK
jgi:acetyl-CoA synthetase